MKHVLVLLLLGIGLVAGQLISIPLAAGARISLLDSAVAVLLGVAALTLHRKRFVPRLWAPILGFIGVALISLAATYKSVPPYVIGGGLLYVMRWSLYAALYWVAASTQFSPRVWVRTLLCSGVGIAFAGLVQYVLYPDLRNLSYLGWDPHYQRLFGTLLDPNFTGITLVLTLMLSIGIMPAVKKRVWLVAGMLVSTVALLLTYSRSSWIAFVVGIVVWGVLTRRKVLVAGLVTALVVIVLWLPHTGEGQNLFRTVSAYARLGSAGSALVLIGEKPIVGHGFNILRFVATERSWIDEAVVPSRAGAGLDTSFLFVGATTGIAGMLVYGYLVAGLFHLGNLGCTSEKTRQMAAAYIASLSALLVHSVFINSLFYPWVMVWLWVGTGVLEHMIRADR